MPCNLTCVIKAKPGKLAIKRHKDDNYSIYQFTSWFTLRTGEYDVIIDLRANSKSSTSSKKCNIKLT